MKNIISIITIAIIALSLFGCSSPDYVPGEFDRPDEQLVSKETAKEEKEEESTMNPTAIIKTNMGTMELELYKDKAGKYRFRLKAGNGEVIAVGEAYESKAACENGIESVKKNAPEAPVVEIDG